MSFRSKFMELVPQNLKHTKRRVSPVSERV